MATIRREPERRAAGHPGDGRPEFCGDKKCALFYCATKFGLKGVFHIQNASPLGRPVDTPRAKRPALGVGQPPAPPLPPSPHVLSRGLSHGVSLCAPGAFPRGLPPRLPGLSRGVSPGSYWVFPGDPSPEGGRGEPMGFARTKPRRSNRPAIPGIRPGLAGASQGLLPGPFPGSAWEGHGGMGVVAEETGGLDKPAGARYHEGERAR